MVSNTLLKIYQFGTLTEYFEYIIESHDNGQFDQVKNLYNKMSPKQRHEFILFLTYDSNYSEAQKLHSYIGENC